jgi:hypothetical protein
MDEHPRAGFLRADDSEDLSEIFSEIKILGNKKSGYYVIQKNQPRTVCNI